MHRCSISGNHPGHRHHIGNPNGTEYQIPPDGAILAMHVIEEIHAKLPISDKAGKTVNHGRNLLRKMGKKSWRPGSAAAMFMLNATNPETIKLARAGMVGVGMKVQRFAHDLLKTFARKQTKAPPASIGAAPIKEQVIHFINKKMPGGLPKKTARALLDIEDQDYVPIIRNPKIGRAHV